MLDRNGLACYGFHMPLRGLVQEPARFIEIAQTLGATWMITPYLAPEERGTTPEFWRGLGETLRAGAERVGAHGLKIAWHNHDFEFRPLPDGSLPIAHILEGGGPNVAFEADLAWVVRAGGDPRTVLSRFGDKIRLLQIKDTAPPGTTQDGGWTATGDGIIDWQGLVPLLRDGRIDHFVVEHDNPSDWRDVARRSIAFFRSLPL